LSFLDHLRERAARSRARIGFPEAREPRTAEAILLLAREGIVRPVVVESAAQVDASLIGTDNVELLDPYAPGNRGKVADLLPEVGPGGPVDTLRFAAAQLRRGRLDGVVAGARNSTADVLRAGLQVLGLRPGIRTVSSSFYMVLSDADGERVLTFADAAVVPEPSAEQLAEIAESAADARRDVVGDEPRVAFLSFSTHGSADGDSVRRVREGLRLFRAGRPDILCDGELQVDAALDADVATRKAPGSPVAGQANVLIFPDLDAGNIGYKLVHRLAGAHALGPILQGLDRPLNDLSRGASVDDIVHVTYITALMAAGAAGRKHTVSPRA
jgi:phosphate acetyltransferase